MGILNVDNLRAVGSGTTVTCLSNRLETTNINSTGVITATTFSGNLTGTINTAAQGNITSLGTLNGLVIDQNQDISMNASVTGQLIVGGNGYTSAIALDGDAMHLYHNSSSRALVLGTNETERLRITGAGKVGISSDSPIAKLDVSGSGAEAVIRARRTDSNGGWNLFEGRSDINGANVFTVSNNGVGYFKGNVSLASGSGIDFSATSDATGKSSELLDDYEEGEYIPTVTAATSGSWTTTSYRYLAYIKIGKLVHIQGYLNINSESSPNGSVRISLPYSVDTSLSQNAEYGNISVSMRSHGGSNIYNLNGSVSSNYIELIAVNGSGSHNWLDHADIGSSWNLRIGGCYITS